MSEMICPKAKECDHFKDKACCKTPHIRTSMCDSWHNGGCPKCVPYSEPQQETWRKEASEWLDGIIKDRFGDELKQVTEPQAQCTECGHDIRIHYKENGCNYQVGEAIACFCRLTPSDLKKPQPLREQIDFALPLIDLIYTREELLDRLVHIAEAWHNAKRKGCIGSTIVSVEPIEVHDAAIRAEERLNTLMWLRANPNIKGKAKEEIEAHIRAMGGQG